MAPTQEDSRRPPTEAEHEAVTCGASQSLLRMLVLHRLEDHIYAIAQGRFRWMDERELYGPVWNLAHISPCAH
jgi:hypothetical protein